MTTPLAPSLLLPVGNHFFSPEALQKAAAEAMAEHPDAKRVFKGTVDSNGVNTVLVMKSADGHSTISTSFSHDWTGDSKFGAAGSFAW
jgi:hypothetical protein